MSHDHYAFCVCVCFFFANSIAVDSKYGFTGISYNPKVQLYARKRHDQFKRKER